MRYTKAYFLRSSLVMALHRVRLHVGRRFLKLGLTEQQRFEIADSTIAQLRRFNSWKELDDVVEPGPIVPAWIDGKPPPAD